MGVRVGSGVRGWREVRGREWNKRWEWSEGAGVK